MDYLSAALLELDPDLMVQEGPGAVSPEVVDLFIRKWDALQTMWASSWRELLQEVCVCVVVHATRVVLCPCVGICACA